nr:unnamed protein product [Callosobruchus analis]
MLSISFLVHQAL